MTRVAGTLGFVPSSPEWRYVAELASVRVETPLAPLDAEDARGRCGLLGLPDVDTAAVVETLPSADRTAAWWWCVERASARLAADIGNGHAPRGTWPDFAGDASVDADRRCHFLHVALAVAPRTVAYHVAHGVRAEEAWPLLGDVAHHVRVHRRRHGTTGMNAAWWVTITLCGELVQLGRLQYHRYVIGDGDESPPWYTDEEAERRGPGFRRHEACLGVHIPDAGPLDPEAVDDSLRAAARFFSRHYPLPGGQGRRVATCRSWLLDPQLARALPASSRIVAFQRRFEPVDASEEDGDDEVLEFVFRAPPGTSLDTLPRRTSLERAVIEHLEAGGHWHRCTGWLELPAV